MEQFAIGAAHLVLPCLHPLRQLAITVAKQDLLVHVSMSGVGDSFVGHIKDIGELSLDVAGIEQMLRSENCCYSLRCDVAGRMQPQ